MMDPLTKIEIDLAAMRHALDRPDLDRDVPLGQAMTDDDFRAGIRKVFGEEEGFEEWMVDPLLAKFKEADALDRQMMSLAGLVVGSVFGGCRL